MNGNSLLLPFNDCCCGPVDLCAKLRAERHILTFIFSGIILCNCADVGGEGPDVYHNLSSSVLNGTFDLVLDPISTSWSLVVPNAITATPQIVAFGMDCGGGDDPHRPPLTFDLTITADCAFGSTNISLGIAITSGGSEVGPTLVFDGGGPLSGPILNIFTGGCDPNPTGSSNRMAHDGTATFVP